MYARLARTLTDMADKYAMRHRAHIEAQMPADPLMVVFSDAALADAFWPGFAQRMEASPPRYGIRLHRQSTKALVRVGVEQAVSPIY